MSADDRREALIDAAFRVIADKGLAAATTRAIVAEAGASLASFHYVFESRDAMMAELITVVTASESASVLGSLSPSTSIRETLERGFRSYLDLVRDNPSREQAMFELTQYALRTPGLSHLAAQQYQTYYRVAGELLAAGAAASGITWSRPLSELARILITLSDGLTIAWLADRDDAATERVIDVAVDTLAAFALPPTERTDPEESR